MQHIFYGCKVVTWWGEKMFVLKNIIFTDMTRTLPSINMAKIKGSYCYFWIFYIYEQKRPVFISPFLRWKLIKENKKFGKKKESFLFFLVAFLVKSVFSFFFFSWPLSFFLDRFLGRECVFCLFFSWSLSWSKACFLTFLFVFFYKFSPQDVWNRRNI